MPPKWPCGPKWGWRPSVDVAAKQVSGGDGACREDRHANPDCPEYPVDPVCHAEHACPARSRLIPAQTRPRKRNLDSSFGFSRRAAEVAEYAEKMAGRDGRDPSCARLRRTSKRVPLGTGGHADFRGRAKRPQQQIPCAPWFFKVSNRGILVEMCIFLLFLLANDPKKCYMLTSCSVGEQC